MCTDQRSSIDSVTCSLFNQLKLNYRICAMERHDGWIRTCLTIAICSLKPYLKVRKNVKVQTVKITDVKLLSPMYSRTNIKIERFRFRVFLNTKSLLLIVSVIGIYSMVKLRRKIDLVVKVFSEFLYRDNDNCFCLCANGWGASKKSCS